MPNSEAGLGLVSRPERTVYAASKDPHWLAKVQQAARAEHVTLKTASSITSLVSQAAEVRGTNGQEIECILIDHDPAVQQWTSIEQLLFEKNVAAPVILVLDNADDFAATEAIARVAHVVATRTMEVPEIIEALQEARGLQTWVRHQFDVLRCHRMYEQLLDRQRKIVDLVVDGAPNKKIATELNVSVKTIERERQRAYKQLSVRSTAEMTRVVILASLHGVVFPSKVLRRRNLPVNTETESRIEPRIDSTALPRANAPAARPSMANIQQSPSGERQHFA